MSDPFPVASFVRYREDGPRGALRGCIGKVAAPSEEGASHNWTRVSFNGSYKDYAAEELEAARFWAVLNDGHFGPFDSWDAAKQALIRNARDEWQFELTHPLGRQRDQLLAEIEAFESRLPGLGANWELGTCYIKVGGVEAPLKTEVR